MNLIRFDGARWTITDTESGEVLPHYQRPRAKDVKVKRWRIFDRMEGAELGASNPMAGEALERFNRENPDDGLF